MPGNNYIQGDFSNWTACMRLQTLIDLYIVAPCMNEKRVR